MSFCPNKSSQEYKALVSQFGEAGAYSAWYLKNKNILNNKITNEPTIPSIIEANEILGNINYIKPTFSLNKDIPSFNKEYQDLLKEYPFINKSIEPTEIYKLINAINNKYKTLIAQLKPIDSNTFKVDILKKDTLKIEKFDEYILKKIQSKFPSIKYKTISVEQAVELVGEKGQNANSFILNDTVYFIKGKVNSETMIEEFLHPFIQYLSTNNKELFDNLLAEAMLDTKLKTSIITRYVGFTVKDKEKELVTQKLAQILNKEFNNSKKNIEETTSLLKTLYKELSKFFNSIFQSKNNIQFENLSPKMSLDTLAQIINTENVILPVEFLFKPTYSIIDNIEQQAKDGQWRVEGATYQDKNNKTYIRLTEWVRNTFSKSKSQNWQKEYAEKRFSKLPQETENGIVYGLKPDGTKITLEELTNEIKLDFNTAKNYGIIAHALIEKAIKIKLGVSTADINAKIEALAAGDTESSAINLVKLNWIENNIEKIMNIVGINVLDKTFTKDQQDKILSELPYVLEQLGIGTTIDGLVEHTDGTISIKDWKTGNLLNDSLTTSLLGEFGNQIEDIKDSKLDKARLEVVLRALMIKFKNPEVKFRKLSIEHLNKNTLVTTYDIHLPSYLKMLEEHFSKTDPVLYKELNDRNLFDYFEYGVQIVQDEKIIENKENTLKKLDEEIVILNNQIKVEKNEKTKGILKWKLREATSKRLEYSSALPVSLISEEGPISWFKRHFGNLSSVSDPILSTFKTLLDKAKFTMKTEEDVLFEEFDNLQKQLLKEFNGNYKNIGLKYKSKDQTGLYDFMWVERNTTSNKGYYRINEELDKEKWKTLTDTQKKYVKFFSESLEKLYGEVANSVVSIDVYGRPVTNASFNNQPISLPKDFMPRVYLDLGEFIDKEGLSKNVALWEYNKFKNNFLRSEFYAKNGTEVLPFKHMGSDVIIGSQMHTFNAEIAYKQFVKNLLRKKHLDSIQMLGNGISSQFTEQGKFKNAEFLDDRLVIEITQMKKSTSFTKKGLRAISNNKISEIDVDNVIDFIKGFVTAGTMWLKPFAGLKNGVYTLMQNNKNRIIKTIAKRYGVPEEDLDYTTENLMQANKIWLEYQTAFLKSYATGEEIKDNKLHLLLKKYNYLPDAFDFKVKRQDILSQKNSIVSKDMLYVFHSVFEDWGTGSIFTAILLHKKNEKTGKSIYDSYEIENNNLEWKGGIRGKREDGSIIEGITYEELNKYKKISSVIHGNYRDDEKAAIELYAWGRMMMQFKRFVPQQLMNLGQSKQLSTSLGKFQEIGKDKDGISIYSWKPEVIEGKMRLMFGHLKNVIGIGAGRYDFEKLSSKQKEDLISSYVTIFISVMGMILTNLAFDDDEEEQYLAQSWFKIFKDLSDGMNPLDMLENFQYSSVSVAKLMKISKALGEFLTSVVTGDKTKQGRYKGSNELAKILPPFSTIYDVDKALNNVKSGNNVGFNIFSTDEFNWNFDNTK
jgi:hypothetical protein